MSVRGQPPQDDSYISPHFLPNTQNGIQEPSSQIPPQPFDSQAFQDSTFLSKPQTGYPNYLPTSIQPYPSQSPSTGDKLSLLTLNVGLLEYSILGIKVYQNPPFTNQRLQYLPGALLESGADIIAIQEVYRQDHVQFILEKVIHVYPYCGRVNSGSFLALHNGLMVLSKYPILKQSFHPHKQVTPIEWFFGSKGILEVVTSIPQIGIVTLFNMHMASGAVDPESNFVETVRNHEIHQLLSFCKDAMKRNEIPIVIGDLNSDPELCASNYKMFLNEGWVDSWLFSCANIDPYSFVVSDTYLPSAWSSHSHGSSSLTLSAQPTKVIQDITEWLITVSKAQRNRSSSDLGHKVFTSRAHRSSSLIISPVHANPINTHTDHCLTTNYSSPELLIKPPYSDYSPPDSTEETTQIHSPPQLNSIHNKFQYSVEGHIRTQEPQFTASNGIFPSNSSIQNINVAHSFMEGAFESSNMTNLPQFSNGKSSIKSRNENNYNLSEVPNNFDLKEVKDDTHSKLNHPSYTPIDEGKIKQGVNVQLSKEGIPFVQKDSFSTSLHSISSNNFYNLNYIPEDKTYMSYPAFHTPLYSSLDCQEYTTVNGNTMGKEYSLDDATSHGYSKTAKLPQFYLDPLSNKEKFPFSPQENRYDDNIYKNENNTLEENGRFKLIEHNKTSTDGRTDIDDTEKYNQQILFNNTETKRMSHFLRTIIKEVTWDPKNLLNAIGPHRHCHGLRSDYIFLPPTHAALKLRNFVPYKSRLLFKKPTVRLHSGANSIEGSSSPLLIHQNVTTQAQQHLHPSNPFWCMCPVEHTYQAASLHHPTSVTLSDHYGVFLELRRRH